MSWCDTVARWAYQCGRVPARPIPQAAAYGLPGYLPPRRQIVQEQRFYDTQLPISNQDPYGVYTDQTPYGDTGLIGLGKDGEITQAVLDSLTAVTANLSEGYRRSREREYGISYNPLVIGIGAVAVLGFGYIAYEKYWKRR